MAEPVTKDTLSPDSKAEAKYKLALVEETKDKAKDALPPGDRGGVGTRPGDIGGGYGHHTGFSSTECKEKADARSY